MAFISAVNSISHQESFRNSGFTEAMKVLPAGSDLIKPDFKEVISPSKLRRLGDLLRISAVSGMAAVLDASWEQPDAISVGTGLGCLADTHKFLEGFVREEGNTALSPTPFIQSTHNTIGGLLSLLMVNHGYNMTHTQNSLSFEHALIDGLSLIATGTNKVLVGAADEAIDELKRIGQSIDIPIDSLTSGASFFALENAGESDIEIVSCRAIEASSDQKEDLELFLKEHETSINSIDLILHSGGQVLTGSDFGGVTIDYSSYTGQYFTSSALATHFAFDILRSGFTSIADINMTKPANTVLICNQLLPGKLGLTLIRKR